MIYKKIFSILLGIILLTSIMAATNPVTSQSSTIIVDQDGTQDYQTIQSDIGNASEGDTIVVNTGEYIENIVIDKLVTLQGNDTGSGRPIINGNETGNGLELRANGITVKNFKIINSGTYSGIEIQSDSNLIQNNNITQNNDEGIYLHNNRENIIENNYISMSDDYGIHLEYSNNNTIQNNLVANGETANGIHLYSSSDNSILDNQVLDNDIGIYLKDSSNRNTLENNEIKFNYYDGVQIESVNNIIRGNQIQENDSGIYFRKPSSSSTSQNLVENNDIVLNDGDGIYLYSNSNDNIIHNNNVTDNADDGIVLYGTVNNVLSNNKVEGNEKGIILSGSSFLGSDNNLIENNVILSNEGHGIHLRYGSTNNTIKNTTISNNYWGVYLQYSSNNTIKDSIITNNSDHGVYSEYSNDNFINNSNISNNNDFGVNLEFSNNITISDSTVSGNTNNGILLYSSSVSNDRSINNTIKNNKITDNGGYGVNLYKSRTNTINKNTISNHNDGGGLSFYDSSNNNIYLNNFIDNRDQVQVYSNSDNIWISLGNITYTYDGTEYSKKLGNYWDDYTGNDSNNDGIGETAYSIDPNDQDTYPLIDPAENYPIKDIETINQYPVSNYTHNPENPLVNETIQFNSTSYDLDGSITSYDWNFGDGTNSTLENPTHSYNSKRNYTVELEITDNDGAKNTTQKTINVTEPIMTTIIVDEDGTEDYRSIQNAIDNANNGDKIIVHSGEYRENIEINKTYLTLIGEDTGKGKPIINGTEYNPTVTITANHSTIENFKITSEQTNYYLRTEPTEMETRVMFPGIGINIRSKQNLVQQNVIENTVFGILVSSEGIIGAASNSINTPSDNIIKDNQISKTQHGILIESTRNLIQGNNLTSNTIPERSIDEYGIILYNAGNNTVLSNNIQNRVRGIEISNSFYNTIQQNNVTNSYIGINLYSANENIIRGNQIHKNENGIKLQGINTGNYFFLNNFKNNNKNLETEENTPSISIIPEDSGTNTWNTPIKADYIYNFTDHENKLGNYYDTYEGIDENGNGVGESNYTINENIIDNYPLSEENSNYIIYDLSLYIDEPEEDNEVSLLKGKKFRIRTKSITNPVQSLTLTTEEDTTQANITIKHIEKPKEIPEPKNTYSYTEINVTKQTDEKIDATIRFTVPKTWIQNQNRNPKDIVMQRYHNNQWKDLETELIRETITHYEYTATTQEFSYFSIGLTPKTPRPKDSKITGSPITIIFVRNNPENNELVKNATVTLEKTSIKDREYPEKRPGLYSHSTTTTNGNGAAIFYTAPGPYQATVTKNEKILEQAKFYKPGTIKGITIYLNGTNKGTIENTEE